MPPDAPNSISAGGSAADLAGELMPTALTDMP